MARECPLPLLPDEMETDSICPLPLLPDEVEEGEEEEKVSKLPPFMESGPPSKRCPPPIARPERVLVSLAKIDRESLRSPLLESKKERPPAIVEGEKYGKKEVEAVWRMATSIHPNPCFVSLEKIGEIIEAAERQVKEEKEDEKRKLLILAPPDPKACLSSCAACKI